MLALSLHFGFIKRFFTQQILIIAVDSFGILSNKFLMYLEACVKKDPSNSTYFKSYSKLENKQICTTFILAYAPFVYQ